MKAETNAIGATADSNGGIEGHPHPKRPTKAADSQQASAVDYRYEYGVIYGYYMCRRQVSDYLLRSAKALGYPVSFEDLMRVMSGMTDLEIDSARRDWDKCSVAREVPNAK